MGLKCGIVGLPNVGKSTLFNALSSAGAEASNFPFCTIEPNVAIVPVPDERLTCIAEIVRPLKVTPVFIELVDIAGLVKGASEGKGMGNAFLSHIREVDLIIHVIRCFEDENVAHVEGDVDALRDLKIIEDELILKDLETLEKRILRLSTMAKSGDRAVREELEFAIGLKEFMEDGRKAVEFMASKGDISPVKNLFLLTAKPFIYVCNVSERDLPDGLMNEEVRKVKEYAGGNGSHVITLCAKVEAEVAELAEDEKRAFLRDFGLESSGLEKLLRTAYKMLGLLTFFTVGPKEVRAWTIRAGTKAPQAAGVIHTDFEKGFIRAETIRFEDFVKYGSEHAVREAGRMRSEGRDYVVEDGDIMHFRFNV